MKNNQVLPFERNRYFPGKLLTTADFLTEQTYFNNKRRFSNRLLFGAGIVCGLSVYNLDDLSVMVESGAAIDSTGREIVLVNSMVRKISAIEGFDELTSDEISLCLKYSENDAQPVYSIGMDNEENKYQYNRVNESGTLFLLDKEKAHGGLLAAREVVYSEFLSTACVYTDNDYEITVSIPAVVPCQKQVKLEVAVTRRSDTIKTLSVRLVLLTPAFTNTAGERELTVKLDDALPERESPLIFSYWLTAGEAETDATMIILKTQQSVIKIDGADIPLDDTFMLKTALSEKSPAALIERETARTNLESRNEQAEGCDYIWLADLNIHKTKTAYIIDSIDEHSLRQYIPTIADKSMRREYSGWFSPFASDATGAPIDKNTAPMPLPQDPISTFSTRPEQTCATGVLEIPFGAEARKGHTVFSDEIMHGLGKGNIYVNVGFEYFAEDKRLRNTAKNTIYGDPSLFNDKDLPITFADTAVKVMNERGSFIVAAKLTRDTNYVMLVLRWVAIKLPSGEEHTLRRHITDKSIYVSQPTIAIGARESHYFDVRFKNMEPVTLTYTLTESNSGTITPDGIYTAPNKEGVYEIMIKCADMPEINTCVYVVVNRKHEKD